MVKRKKLFCNSKSSAAVTVGLSILGKIPTTT
jgi:hypothetical protein